MKNRGMRTFKAGLFGLAVAAACATSGGRTAKADFLFNPTGVGGAGGAVTASAFDPAVGNALAKGGNAAVTNFATGGPAAGNTFQLYYQATMGAVLGSNGLPITNGPLAGLGTTYQITVVASITEVVTSVAAGGTSATFSIAPVQAANSFLRMFENPTVVNDNLAGTGFTAGTQILSATPIATPVGSGAFTTVPGAIQLFDQHNADNYAGKQSVVSTAGSASTIDFRVDSTNPAFFITPPPTIVGLEFVTTAQTPFRPVDPSALFQGLGPAGANVIPVLGPINGAPFTAAVSNTDFQFAADANVTPIPEPTSVCLMGLGLVGLVAYSRRKLARIG